MGVHSFSTMACLKPIVPKEEDAKKLNIDKRKAINYPDCVIKDAVSMDVIFGLLSGPDNT